jgi:iron-sulfur cluster assembly protein
MELMGKLNFGMPVMRLTEAAAERLREIVDNADHPVAGLRVGVKNAGCAGMAYALDTVDQVDPADDVVEERGVKVFVDPKAVLFLLGSVMDYKADKLSSGFIFQNPNEVSACGCGESVKLKPAELPASA